MRIQSLAGAWEFRQAGAEEWLPAGWTPSQVQAALKVRSVYDSYAHGAAK